MTTARRRAQPEAAMQRPISAGAACLVWSRGIRRIAARGRSTESQLESLAAMEAASAFTCIAEGLDRALAVLEGWDLLGGRAAAWILVIPESK